MQLQHQFSAELAARTLAHLGDSMHLSPAYRQMTEHELTPILTAMGTVVAQELANGIVSHYSGTTHDPLMIVYFHALDLVASQFSDTIRQELQSDTAILNGSDEFRFKLQEIAEAFSAFTEEELRAATASSTTAALNAPLTFAAQPAAANDNAAQAPVPGGFVERLLKQRKNASNGGRGI